MTTRTLEDELTVTADLSGVDPDDITVGFDDGTLVVGVGSRALERVSIPWTESSAEAAVRNGILTVTVTPDSGAGSSADSMETESETTAETEDTDTDTNTEDDT